MKNCSQESLIVSRLDIKIFLGDKTLSTKSWIKWVKTSSAPEFVRPLRKTKMASKILKIWKFNLRRIKMTSWWRIFRITVTYSNSNFSSTKMILWHQLTLALPPTLSWQISQTSQHSKSRAPKLRRIQLILARWVSCTKWIIKTLLKKVSLVEKFWSSELKKIKRISSASQESRLMLTISTVEWSTATKCLSIALHKASWSRLNPERLRAIHTES